jgi:hypothetical protein
MKRQAIQSKIADIEQLRLYPFPVRPVAVARAVRTGRATVAIGKDGRIYTTQADAAVYWTTVDRKADTIACLVKLNMLSAKAVAQHRAAEQEETRARAIKYAADSVLDNAAVAGITLTKAQHKQLLAAAKSKVDAP